jgi:hypothetical protein
MIGQKKRKNAVEVFYDGYYRCDVKRCSKCGNNRPLDMYHRSSETKIGYRSSCKLCVRDDVKSPRRHRMLLANAKKHRKLSPEKFTATRKRYEERMGKAALLQKQKENKVRRENRTGVSPLRNVVERLSGVKISR